jgi:hypothetical protein
MLMMKNPLSVPVRNRPRSCSPSSSWGRLFLAVLAVTALFVLSACEETRHDISKALGLEKPDFNEEEVLTGEPLAIPPNFDLRPPGSSYPSADSGAPGAVALQLQAIPVLQQPAQRTYPGAYPAQGAYPGAYSAQGTYPAQPAHGQAAPQAISPSAAQNVFTQAIQAYGHANTGGYATTPSGAAAQPYGGGQPVYAQQPYTQQPGAQDMSSYQGQAQALPPVANPAAAPIEASESIECNKVTVDYSGKYICVE